MMLDHETDAPFEVTATSESARDFNVALRRDHVRWPDGLEADYRSVDCPSAVFVVPYSQSGTTMLVRQWRHTWQTTSWEVPAGTLEPGEEPLACAHRELREEAGLIADEWTSLGETRGAALLTGQQHLFLARGLHRVQRTPEPYERDMILREVPFHTALDAALRGEVVHAASIAALTRAARVLGII
jgi:8-oxo-dGTP pyrophosphatase MutT (NUDIX family)